MTHNYYPVALDLSNKNCLVVGGGVIAEGKLDALLMAGARVTVVGPEFLPRVGTFAAAGKSLFTSALSTQRSRRRLSRHRRHRRPPANAAIAVAARARSILVNAVDDIPYCDFFAMAIVRRGDLQLGISTNGHSPAFARWMRELLDETLPVEYGLLLASWPRPADRSKPVAPFPNTNTGKRPSPTRCWSA